MADYDRIMTALRNAHAAGDTSAATRLAAMAKAAKPAATSQPPSATTSVEVPGRSSAPVARQFSPQQLAAMEAAQPSLPAPAVQRQQPGTAIAGDGTEMVLNPATGQYTSRELMANNMRPTAGQAFVAGASQGITMGLGDEVAGAIGGPFLREKGRAAVDAAQRDRPMATLAGEAGAAMSLPVASTVSAATLPKAALTGAATGAAYGGVYGAATADGGAENRAEAGATGAVAGALFGAAVPVAVNFGTRAWRRLFNSAAEKPSIESLRTAKTAAYDAVDRAGDTFDATETQALADAVKAELAQTNYVPGVDTQTDAVMRLLENKAGQTLSLGQLDKLRQNFFSRYNKASNETGILDAIDAIDGMIQSRAATSDLLAAARLSNSQYKKAELLDLAFQKARDQTASTGSGGNILNKYRQAVTSIINNPKQAKWFNADEIATMRGFIEGNATQNTLRLIGKLSPGGNGLMTALNLGAVTVNPAMLGVSALASGAKAISDGATERGATALISKVAGQAPALPAPIRYPQRVNALAGPLAN